MIYTSQDLHESHGKSITVSLRKVIKESCIYLN